MPTNLQNLFDKEKSLGRTYWILRNKFASDNYILGKLATEFSALRKAIEDIKKGKNIQETAAYAGISTESLRRWSNGSLPRYFSYGLETEVDLGKLVENEDFVSVLGILQSHTKGRFRDMIRIVSNDKYLWPVLENYLERCFGEKVNSQNNDDGSKYFSVSSRPLVALLNGLTEDNSDVPKILLKSDENKKEYCSGFLVNLKVCTDQCRELAAGGHNYRIHASITRSRGNLIEGVDGLLNELGLEYGYSESSSRIRFRGKRQCRALIDFLPECSPKWQLDDYLRKDLQ